MFIMENIDDKNPRENDGHTPLHYAAQEGNLEICRLMMENIDDKNPVTNDGRTPQDLARQNNHLVLCNYIKIFSFLK